MKNIILTLFLVLSGNSKAVENTRSLASIKESSRVDHAKELMGHSYKKSIVSFHEKRRGLERNIYKTVEKRLPKSYKKDARKITETIIREASKHNLDPYFVMAVISGESSFNPLAKGPVGEIGLMQIRSSTGIWMAKMMKLQWKGDATLRDPVNNIKLGTAYLAWLREKFNNHGQLYLAAYNMGPGSVKKALDRKIWPKDYPRHVMKRYIAFYKSI